jgi:hypothetical protein
MNNNYISCPTILRKIFVMQWLKLPHVAQRSKVQFISSTFHFLPHANE